MQQFLSRGIQELKTALSVNQSPTGIIGVPANSTEAELLAQFRDMARGFAAALAGWVEIRSAASDLADEMISAKKMLPC
jgi:ABC-type Co2+ transport system permease subunit